MRYFVSVVFLALCLVAWECTAEGGGTDQGLQGGAGASTDTTAPKSGSQGAPDQQVVQEPEPEPEPEPEAGAEAEPEAEPEAEAAVGDKDKESEGHSNVDPKERTPAVVHPPPEVVATTTTTAKNKVTVDILTPPAGEGHSSTLEEHSPLQTPNNELKPGQQTDNGGGSVRTEAAGVKATTSTGVEPGAQQEGSSPRQGKTTTTTAQVQIHSGSQGGKVQDQSTQSKDGAAPDLTVQDAAAAATTTTTSASTITLPKQSKIPQSGNNKDSSSSTSLLLACAMLATLAVRPVAPVW